ncbi:MAG: hypothetical protein AVDCRST_MAG30-1501, partial [uncultured Solirubrobacteraceae bacterium]
GLALRGDRRRDDRRPGVVLLELPLQPAVLLLPHGVGAARQAPRARPRRHPRAGARRQGARLHRVRRHGWRALHPRRHARPRRRAGPRAADRRPLQRDALQRPPAPRGRAPRRPARAHPDLARPPGSGRERRDARARELPQGDGGDPQARRAGDRRAHRHHAGGSRRGRSRGAGAPLRAAPRDGHPRRGPRRPPDHQPRPRGDQRHGAARRTRAARSRAHADRRRRLLQPVRADGARRAARHRPPRHPHDLAGGHGGPRARAHRRGPPAGRRRVDRHPV